MDEKKPSPSETWQDLNLLDDFLAAGFRRDHSVLEELPAAVSAQGPARGAPQAGTSASGPADRGAESSALSAEIQACTRCALSMNRSQAVPGEGAGAPLVLIVGEGPGEEEDKSGRPFVGRAGQFLDKWLAPIGLDRKNCFIANTVKCRPPQNREPRPEEIEACAPYLDRQIAILRPGTILCLGRIAAHRLLGTQASLASLRGKVHSRAGVPLVVTYHPSAVLRDEALKRPVWEDLKLLKSLL